MKNNRKLQIITTTSLIFTMTAAMVLKPTFVLADEGVATAGQFTAGSYKPTTFRWWVVDCPTMKLNVHIGASYVIARRGQGYKDTVKSL